MRHLDDPRQTDLFDLFADILSPVAYRKLRSGWQHLFRLAILKRLPAGKLADHFHPVIGRPRAYASNPCHKSCLHGMLRLTWRRDRPVGCG